MNSSFPPSAVGFFLFFYGPPFDIETEIFIFFVIYFFFQTGSLDGPWANAYGLETQQLNRIIEQLVDRTL
jgi:hypothetical protein